MKGRITAAELQAKLASDPVYLARMAEQEQRVDREIELLRVAELPLLAALREVGVAPPSVWDLIGAQSLSLSVVDVLIDQLGREYPDKIREGVIRALASRSSFARWNELEHLFKVDSIEWTEEHRGLLAYALAMAADESVIVKVMDLLRDESIPPQCRLPLLLALERSGDARAKMMFLELRKHPFFGSEVKRMRRIARVLEKR